MTNSVTKGRPGKALNHQERKQCFAKSSTERAVLYDLAIGLPVRVTGPPATHPRAGRPLNLQLRCAV
eukprot:3300237-Pyramimonas_sp.AAC.1